jgi:hypothetical protein
MPPSCGPPARRRRPKRAPLLELPRSGGHLAVPRVWWSRVAGCSCHGGRVLEPYWVSMPRLLWRWGVVEDLQVLKDRVGQLEAGGPAATVQQLDLHRDQNASIIALSKQPPTESRVLGRLGNAQDAGWTPGWRGSAFRAVACGTGWPCPRAVVTRPRLGMRRSISRPPGGRRHPGRRRRRPCLAEGCSVMSVTPAGPGWVRAKWRSTRSARPTRRSSSATARSGLKAEAPRLTGPGPGRRPRPGCARSVITATAGNRLGHPLSDPLQGPAQRRSSASSSAIRRLARPARLLGAGQARCQAASMRS